MKDNCLVSFADILHKRQADYLSHHESFIIGSLTVNYSFQFFRIITMQWCSGHNQENVMNVIKISEYKDWFKSQGENQTKITDCIEEGLRHALLLGVCCRNFSEELLDSTYFLLCSGKIDDVFCKFINIIIKLGTDANFFRVFGRSAICHGNCPFDLEIEHVRSLRTTNFKFHRQNKRQFDLASTFDSIGQFICSDMEESSTLDRDAWNPIVTSHLAKKHEGIDSNRYSKEFLYMFVFRKPACCLLDRRSYA